MAESTLSLGYSDFLTEVGYNLGYGRTTANYSTSQRNLVDMCIKTGLRNFYNPPILSGENHAHVWTFMHPVTTLTVGPLSRTVSGVPVEAGGNSTITLTAAGFDTRSDNYTTTVTFATSGTSYTISSVTSTTVAVVTGDASGETSGDTVTISAQQDYDLPDNFGDIEGTITFNTVNEGLFQIDVTSENMIRVRRQYATTGGRPEVAAVRPKSFDGTSGQRYELLVWPPPDGSYELSYKYTAIPNMLTDSAPYPLGGEPHAETIMASCLAVAEERIEDNLGVKKATFMELLRKSINFDREMITPETLGYNHDDSDLIHSERWYGRRWRHSDNNYTTVNGSIP